MMRRDKLAYRHSWHQRQAEWRFGRRQDEILGGKSDARREIILPTAQNHILANAESCSRQQSRWSAGTAHAGSRVPPRSRRSGCQDSNRGRRAPGPVRQQDTADAGGARWDSEDDDR
ncbi:uncharacterized protein SCHCODRAFT_02032193 [Schizophyllum commune H4-8]|uniref:uncharacterized protein n=1 Tax=Schizophyllum commune (strain H4-8 / FGSC 9210) TaxID=578458 RepID=UPI00215FC2A6|nr:uncharacterized protein SCHCODRAFT_02032193 [Schizophyllum commune H4-8]KAI5900238.1 hypothetical protein SCHCODRAFT_02032193 [Schizophyllum commune H4-8]